MPSRVRAVLGSWSYALPVLAVIVFAATWGSKISGLVVVIASVLLAGAVLAAVGHAEVVAHRVGQPLGALVLAVSVTVIEVALIVTLMLSSGPDKSALARDTVFAALMITCNGIVGISILMATLRRRVTVFNPEGTGAALATITALATLSLVLPTFTTTTPGPTFSSGQLTFAALASLAVYALYIFVQTVRHKEDFLPAEVTAPSAALTVRKASGTDELSVWVADAGGVAAGNSSPGSLDTAVDAESHHEVTDRAAWLSVTFLMIALVGVVGLAKAVSPSIEGLVRDAGLPLSFVGVVIAFLVLLPEGIAAARAARGGHMQTSFNLAYGSAVASIGLTIPAIAVASIWMTQPLELGLSAVEMVLLGLTVVIGVLTVTPGRATLLQGGVHLAVFAGFLVLAMSP
ncbi:MAG: hypothetical protein WBB44_04690 [Candidatus Nanopelagicales bacterium]|nr:hypothetical protein [Candidatus Nanopelagicales bacterium]